MTTNIIILFSKMLIFFTKLKKKQNIEEENKILKNYGIF
jgi:hypothetical protein